MNMPEYGDSGSVTVRDGIFDRNTAQYADQGHYRRKSLLGKVAIRGEISNLNPEQRTHIFHAQGRAERAACGYVPLVDSAAAVRTRGRHDRRGARRHFCLYAGRQLSAVCFIS